MKHTPGPWKVGRYLTQGQFVTETKITDMENSYLAKVGPVNIEANARIMAQAPKMALLLRVAMDRVYGKGIKDPAFGLSSENSLAEQILELLEGLSR